MVTTNKSKVSLFSKINLRIAAIILSVILVQSVAVGSVIAVKSEPIADQYGSAARTAYPAIELQWKPVKPVAGEDVTFSVLFRDASSGTAKSHVDYTFTISKEGKVAYTTSKHTHSGTDTINQKLADAGSYSISVTITGIDFNKVEPKSSDFSLNVEKQAVQEQPTPVAPSPAATRAEVMLDISTLSDSYSANQIVSAKVMIHGGKAGDNAVARIISPDGKVVSSVNIAIAEEKFEASLSIGSIPSDAISGTWKVTLEYAGKSASSTFKVPEVKPEVATKPVTSIEIKSDKDTYSIGETARAKGIIRSSGGSGTGKIMIFITGPDGKVYLRNEMEPARDGSFEFSFDIKKGYPVGTWNVNARETTTGLDVDYRFKVIEPQPSATPAKPATEEGKPSLILRDKDGRHVVFINTGGEAPEGGLVEYVLLLDGKGFNRSTDLTILVLDPDENIYVQDEVTTGSDGSFSFSFKLENDAKLGTWSIQVVTGDSIGEVIFDVVSSAAGQAEATAIIKNLKKLTLISIKNSGTEDIWAISMKVKQGSIQFVKVISKQFKDWDRIRIASDEVVVGPQGIAVTDEGVPNDKGVKNKRTLQPGENTIIIIKWNDRPEIAGSMKVEFGENNPFFGSNYNSSRSHY